MINKGRVTFEENGHIYTDTETGKQLPSVSTIIKESGNSPRYFGNSRAQIGTQVHSACTDMELLGSDPSEWPGEVGEYLKSIQRWLEMTRPVLIDYEAIVYWPDDEPKYAGMLDRIYQIQGDIYVVDWKTGKKAEHYKAQIAAYAQAVGLDRGIIVYPTSKGPYQVETIIGPQMDYWKSVFNSYLGGINGKGE